MDSRRERKNPGPEGPDLAAQEEREKGKDILKSPQGMRIAVALGIVMAFVLLIALGTI